ncbi:MAG: MalY/PatB family protein [Qingshengfaniella sp.]
MDFDTPINRRGTNCSKWDMMEPLHGVPAEDGLAMWVADMDFRAPDPVQQAVARLNRHGIYGYPGSDAAYRQAICWWMDQRHGWNVDPEWIFSTHGLVNGTALCVDTWTDPGDAVVVMSPVYHAFARVIRAAGRELRECPLKLNNDRYEMDFDTWDGMMQGNERLLILCSPHNPGGRVWTAEELHGVAAFARRHDLILVSDEIHSDLILPGHRHLPMSLAAPDIRDRLVMMTAATKTFNIAGAHIGNVIIEDDLLRQQFAGRMDALGMSPGLFGLEMVTAAYSPDGAAWVDALCRYLDTNRQIFDQGIAAIPGLRSMPLEGTYLAWVDFADTGMTPTEFTDRVQKEARIAVNGGGSFGLGGDSFLRFNLGMPKARIEEAVARLHKAFADLQ